MNVFAPLSDSMPAPLLTREITRPAAPEITPEIAVLFEPVIVRSEPTEPAVLIVPTTVSGNARELFVQVCVPFRTRLTAEPLTPSVTAPAVPPIEMPLVPSVSNRAVALSDRSVVVPKLLNERPPTLVSALSSAATLVVEKGMLENVPISDDVGTEPPSQLPVVAQVPDPTFHVRRVWASAARGPQTDTIATAARTIAPQYHD